MTLNLLNRTFYDAVAGRSVCYGELLLYASRLAVDVYDVADECGALI